MFIDNIYLLLYLYPFGHFLLGCSFAIWGNFITVNTTPLLYALQLSSLLFLFYVICEVKKERVQGPTVDCFSFYVLSLAVFLSSFFPVIFLLLLLFCSFLDKGLISFKVSVLILSIVLRTAVYSQDSSLIRKLFIFPLKCLCEDIHPFFLILSLAWNKAYFLLLPYSLGPLLGSIW